MSNYSIYFVLNGLQNGEDGIGAVTTDGRTQRDGWYYIPFTEDDGTGPYISREQAVRKAELNNDSLYAHLLNYDAEDIIKMLNLPQNLELKEKLFAAVEANIDNMHKL